MGFQNRVVLITGASSGIGSALAKELSSRGAKLGLLARREEQLRQLREEIQSSGGTAEYAVADIVDRGRVVEAIHSLEAKLGSADVLIANAGVGSTNPMDDLNIAASEMVIRVNLFGVMYSIEAVLPAMLKRGSGQIAAVSSLAAYKGLPSSAAYCASKAAVNVYMESLRIQLHRKGVAFTTICPGFIKTPMTENSKGMMFVMSAEKAARKIAGAIQRKKKVYNFPWITSRLMKLTYWAPDWIMRRAVKD